MMTALLFLFAILALFLQNLGYKLMSRFVRCDRDSLLFTSLILSFVAGISLLQLTSVLFFRMTFLLGALFAFFFALCEFSYMMALATGPMSYTSLFLSCALIIPAGAGMIFWGEPVKALRIFGTALLLISFFLGLSKEGREPDKKRFRKWLLFGILTFVSNGMVSVLQKMAQQTLGSGQTDAFMTVSFVLASLFMWLLFLFKKPAGQPIPGSKRRFSYKPLLFALVTAAASAVGNKLVLVSASQIDAGILFPVLNGGILVLSSLAAFLFFKETLTKKQWLGLGLGTASVLLISL